MDKSIVHIAFFSSLSLFVITLIFQLSLYRTKQNRKFSFRNELPFELVQGADIKFITMYYCFL
jgi:hypothetical protein